MLDEGIFGLGAENIFGDGSGDGSLGTENVSFDYVKGLEQADVSSLRPTTSSSKTTTTSNSGSGGSSVVTNIQQQVVNAGCSVGSTGIDGIWGPNTAAGVRCYAQKMGWDTAQQQFGQYATMARGGTTTTTTTTPAVASQAAIQQTTVAPTDRLPAFLKDWKIWAAAGTVLGLGYFGYRYYNEKKAEETADALVANFLGY